MIEISGDANQAAMDDLAADTKLINDLCAWAGKKPSRIASDLGMAATTLTRPANGKATTKIGRQTLNALREAFPDFPGFTDQSHLQPNATIVGLEGASLEEAPDDLPVWGTMLGAVEEYEGEAIEQTMLNSGDTIEYVARPAILKRKEVAYALYVQGSSMHPSLKEGSMHVAVKGRTIRSGDDVVVYLKANSGHEDDNERARAVLVKEYIRATGHFYELRQYQPYKEFRIPRDEVSRIDRILTTNEMLETR